MINMPISDIEAPKISIILPVYNSEKTLNRCIDSILSQDYVNWELLLIDDGSTDASKLICEYYSKQNIRINYVTQPNAGVSTTRNRALSMATGKYVCCIDSDDYVSIHYLSNLYKALQKQSGRGMVLSGNYHITPIANYHCKYDAGLYLPAMYGQMMEKYTFLKCSYAWGKLFDIDVVREYNILYPTNFSFGEDLIFLLTYLLHCDYVAITSDADYHYVTSAGSLSSKYHSFKEEYDLYIMIQNLIEKNRMAHSIEDVYLRSSYQWLSYFCLRAIKSMYRSGNSFPRTKRLAILREKLTEEDFSLLKSYHIPDMFLDKVQIQLLYSHRFRLVDVLYRVFFFLRYNRILSFISRWRNKIAKS
jgi:glycosyltransferase involved in cell wall biosynthesis